MTLSNDPLSEIVEAMLQHSDAAAQEYVRRQQPPSWPVMAARCAAISNYLHTLQLADPAAFMASKWPEPLPAVPRDWVQTALEAPNVGRDAGTFVDLDLDQLTALSALIGRLERHALAFCAGANRRTVLDTPDDYQGRLFPN